MAQASETVADAEASDSFDRPAPDVAEKPARKWTLILIRHGETDWNSVGRIQGQEDIALSDTGRFQVRKLGRRFAAACRTIAARPLLPLFGTEPLSVAAQFSSDLIRATETARIVQGSVPHLGPLRLYGMTLLRERHFGAWQGLEGDELRAARAKSGSDTPEGGETEAQVFARMRDALDVIVTHLETSPGTDSRTGLVYGHGGSLRALLCLALGLGADDMRRFRLDNTSLSVVEIEGIYKEEQVEIRGGRLLCVNETAHLLSPEVLV